MSIQFKCGAIPTPRHLLAAAAPHQPLSATPPQYAWIPERLSMWLNNVIGDCVSAEEAFKVACLNPEVFIQDSTVHTWAAEHGVLNGAIILQVVQWMQQAGFAQDGNLYNAGAVSAVDYSNEAILQNAISQGPVKIGIDHAALPQTAGQQPGWFAFGGAPGQFSNEDHCVSICGYGPTAWLFQQLGVAAPHGAPANGYLIFTWSSIGVVDHRWIMSTCAEAWLRRPSTIVVGPNPPPTPPDPPLPPDPPPLPPDPPPLPPDPPLPPGPAQQLQITFDREVEAGDFVLRGSGGRVSGHLPVTLSKGTYTLVGP